MVRLVTLILPVLIFPTKTPPLVVVAAARPKVLSNVPLTVILPNPEVPTPVAADICRFPSAIRISSRKPVSPRVMAPTLLDAEPPRPLKSASAMRLTLNVPPSASIAVSTKLSPVSPTIILSAARITTSPPAVIATLPPLAI